MPSANYPNFYFKSFILEGLLLLLSLSFQLILTVNLELSADAAHYALYAKNLAWSYFDHPPLVGWWTALWFGFIGDFWGIRLASIVPFVFTHFIFKLLVREFLQLANFTEHGIVKRLNLSLILLHSLILWQLIAVGIVPDTLLIPLALAVLYFSQRIFFTKTVSWWDFVFWGILLGLCGLTKYSAIFLVLGLLLTLLRLKRWRLLIDIRFIAAVLIALLLISPVIIWNIQQQGLSLVYQSEHILNGDFSVVNLLLSQVILLAVFSPLYWLLIWGLPVYALFCYGFYKGRKRNLFPSQFYFLLAFAVPWLLFFSVAAISGRSLPHWYLWVFIILLPLVADWMVTYWANLWAKIILLINGLWIAAMFGFLLIVLSPQITLPYGNHPYAELIGWQQATQKAEYYAKRYQADLGVSHWNFASRFSWYAYPKKIYVSDNRVDQFDIWQPIKPWRAVIINPIYGNWVEGENNWQRFWWNCSLLDNYQAEHGDNRLFSFDYYLCEGS